jgi:L-lysine exporter family protein LysE/ArgO
LGIFLFEYFRSLFTYKIELIFNILLFVFLVYFVINKIRTKYDSFDINPENQDISFKNAIIKTLGFTYLNPHVYSDTVFFLGNFSKNFLIIQKYYFGIGASIASFLFFFSLGYLSKLSSKYLQSRNTWKVINLFIVVFMSILALYVLVDIFNLKNRIF